MNTPKELHYAKTHEWLRLEGETATVGITDFAQDQLGDVVYIELPKVGATLSQGEQCAVVESVKTASDIYSPASGEVIAINEALSDATELLNTNPFDDGWMFKIKISAPPTGLLDADAYQTLAESESH